MSRPTFRPTSVARAWLLVFAGVAARLSAGDVIVTVKDAKGLPVADAVVSLVPLDASAAIAPQPPAEPAVIAQKDQEFEPYVTVVVAGTRVRFPNQDNVRHQVFSLSKPKRFEIPLYGPGKEEAVVFDLPGIVALGCNIHDWMSAYVVVLATPHFVKTPADGLARLAGLPTGRYRLEVWQPRLEGESHREIVVAADADTQTISVVLKAEKRVRRAPESAGGGYR